MRNATARTKKATERLKARHRHRSGNSQEENSIINHMSTTIATTLNNSESRFLNVRIGQMVFPPLVVHTVSWTFDMTHTDEFGFPTSGSVSFTGLEGIEITTQNEIASLYPGLPLYIEGNKTGNQVTEMVAPYIPYEK
jgi:hypothetical protein